MENVQINHALNRYLNTNDYRATQLILPLDCAVLIEENDPIRSFCELLEGVNLKAYVKHTTKGRHDYEDLTLLRILLFATMYQITSVRDIEAACRNDIRFIWLGQGIRPSHMTFQRLINERLKGRIEDLFVDITKHLIEKEAIQTDVLYIDGTKFEANATKNSFVWKKAVLKHQAKLYLKITKFYTSLGLETQESYRSEELEPLRPLCMMIVSCIRLNSSVGRETIAHHFRRTPIRSKPIMRSSSSMKNIWASVKCETVTPRPTMTPLSMHRCINASKEDYYMRTGIFKPGYNVQLGVSDEYILMAKTYPNPTDTLTFIPFLENFKKAYGYYPKTPVADAGYGSYDNYLYCLSHGLELYQKYNYYEAEKHGKKEKLIDQTKSMRQADGGYRCPQGKAFIFDAFELKHDGRYPKLLHKYQCEDCTNCPVAKLCKKSEGNRNIAVNPVLFELQDLAKANLDSPRGITLRVQRSIQSESTFDILKYNWGKQRFTRHGTINVENELFLLAIGFNLMKYHQKKMRKKLS